MLFADVDQLGIVVIAHSNCNVHGLLGLMLVGNLYELAWTRLLNPVLDEGKESVLGLAAYVHVLDIEMYLDLRTFGIMKFVELIDEPSWR